MTELEQAQHHVTEGRRIVAEQRGASRLFQSARARCHRGRTYGPDLVGLSRQAADYIDRILRGEKPADLPVHAPIRYDLSINLKTAKELDLIVPSTLLARADEVIE